MSLAWRGRSTNYLVTSGIGFLFPDRGIRCGNPAIGDLRLLFASDKPSFPH
jgi:hypothetical protein